MKRDRTEYNRRWYLAHRDSENAGSREYYAENSDKCKQLSKDWRQGNPEGVKAQKHRHTMKYLAKNIAKITAWKLSEKQRFVNAYGGACTCCGEKEIRFLTCEHLVAGEGIAHRKAGIHGAQLYKAIRLKGYPTNRYTVLCMNCNFARNHGGTCPHKMANSKQEGLRAVAG